MRAVFFDVGGTLIRPWPSVGAVYAAVGCRHGITASAEDLETAFRAAWKRARDRGGIQCRAWWRELVFDAVPAATENYFSELYETFARGESWRVFDDVTETLREARGRGWHVGVISNWDERLRVLLPAVGLGEWDSVTISCEVGAEKPAAGIFQAALRAAGVDAGEAWHVGDSFEEDVAGAEAVGMRAVWVDRSGAGRDVCEWVSDLREIFSTVDRSCKPRGFRRL